MVNWKSTKYFFCICEIFRRVKRSKWYFEISANDAVFVIYNLETAASFSVISVFGYWWKYFAPFSLNQSMKLIFLSAGCIWMARILMCVSFAHKIGSEQKVSEGGKGEVFLFLLSNPLSRFVLLSSQSSHGRNASPLAETFLPTTV